MLSLLAQAAPGKAAIQHVTPVANDVDWWVLALVIAAGCALLTFGVGRVSRFVFKGHPKKKLYGALSRLVLILVCAGVGAIAGWRVWDAWLGGVVGAVGSSASPLIMGYVRKFADRFFNSKKPETPAE